MAITPTAAVAARAAAVVTKFNQQVALIDAFLGGPPNMTGAGRAAGGEWWYFVDGLDLSMITSLTAAYQAAGWLVALVANATSGNALTFAVPAAS